MSDVFEDLAKPFEPRKIKWRIGQSNDEDTRCMPLAYITARHVMNRLDQVVGPENWKDDIQHLHDAYLCRLSIRQGDEWITKVDVAEGTNIESVKGGVSDAFKRAAVKFGIGRYLYGLGDQWVELKPIEKMDNSAIYAGYSKARQQKIGFYPPELPSWAVPDDAESKQPNDVDENTPEPESDESSLDPRPDDDIVDEFIELVAELKPYDEFMDNIANKHFEGQQALNEAQQSDNEALRETLKREVSESQLNEYVNALKQQMEEEREASEESDLVE